MNPASDYWFKSPSYPDMIKQVLNGEQNFIGNKNEIEGDKGVFMMTAKEFFNAFQSIQIAHDHKQRSYIRSWYDVDGDTGLEKSFWVTIPATKDQNYYMKDDPDDYENQLKEYGHIYFTVETYY